ncbi:hypothetical protein ACLHDG_14115 [Sulfurovum sp. CS9]|uniref:hypothetical protein n=1 Tax=Sulfurovum sp. CS9 TaxID=3391146 RepID=UPI0039EA9409
MKNSLGKILLVLLCTLWLSAEDFKHHFTLSNTSPYVKEAVIMTLDLNQTNRDKVLFFHFVLKKSPDYEFHRLNVKETEVHHTAQVHYEYLIYPLRSGEIQLHFDLIQKATTEENLAYSFSGDRDNVKGLTTVDTQIDLPPLTLKAKALPKGTSLVGDFSLTHSLKTNKAKAYEPLPFQVTITGSGYPPLLKDLFPENINFTLFKEKPIVNAVNNSQGTRSTVIYPMALSHSKSFDLGPIVLKAFDPKTQKSYKLRVAEQHFDIRKVDVKSLVDKIDSPKPLESDWSWLTTILMTLFSYLVVFGAGYLTAISLKWKKKSTEQTSHPLKKKIEACKDEKALLQLLMAADSKQFALSIEKLEKGLYRNGKINFNKVKQEALEKIT